MSKIKVRGYVYFQPGPWGVNAPARRISVEIVDKDRTREDVILRCETSDDGYFEGETDDWQNRIKLPFGKSIPDPTDRLDLFLRAAVGDQTVEMRHPYAAFDAPPIAHVLYGLSPTDALRRRCSPHTYLILCAAHLLPSIGPIIEQKQRRGYRVLIRTPNEFGDVSTAACARSIRDYVLGVRPKFLLLVGDQDTTPSYHTGTLDADEEFDGGVYSDNFFGMQDGDIHPGVLVGRISSNDLATVHAVCEALVRYPADPSPGWKRRAILSGWSPWLKRDTDLHNCGWRCEEEIGTYFDKVRLYERDRPEAADVWGTADTSVAALVREMSRGASVVSYYAHGGSCDWTNIGFGARNVGSVDCGDRIPLVLSMACYTGKTRHESLAEALQRQIKAVGVLACDVRSDLFWNERVLPLMYREIVTNRTRRVGEIICNAMCAYASRFGGEKSARHARRYRYLGDPDTILSVPEDDGITDIRQITVPTRADLHGNLQCEPQYVDFGRVVRRSWATLNSSPTGVDLKLVTLIQGTRVEVRITGTTIEPSVASSLSFNDVLVTVASVL